MSKGKRGPTVDKKLFECVKILLESGAPKAEIEKYTRLGHTTIERIKACESFEDWKQYLAAMALAYRERYAKKKQAPAVEPEPEKKPEPEPKPEPEKKPEPQVVEHRQNVTVQTTYFVSQKLDKIEELLKGISAKMAFIVEDLYGTKEKKEEQE